MHVVVEPIPSFSGVVPDPPSPPFLVSPGSSHDASSPMCETQVASQSLDFKHNSLPLATPPGLFPTWSPPTPEGHPRPMPLVPVDLALGECEASSELDEKALNALLPDWFVDKSDLPLAFVATREIVTEVLVKIHRKK